MKDRKFSLEVRSSLIDHLCVRVLPSNDDVISTRIPVHHFIHSDGRKSRLDCDRGDENAAVPGARAETSF
jgi:hypothetical protein